MKKILIALCLCISMAVRAVIILPAQVPVAPPVFTVQTFWASGTNNDTAAVLAVLPTTAPDYAAALAASPSQVIVSTNLVRLGTNSVWFTNTNGVLELDFVNLTNPPNGFLICYPVGNGVLTNNCPAVPMVWNPILSPANAVSLH